MCTVISDEEMNCRSPDLTNHLRDAQCGGGEGNIDSTDLNSLFKFSLGFRVDGITDFNSVADSPWLANSSQLHIEADAVIGTEMVSTWSPLSPSKAVFRLDFKH